MTTGQNSPVLQQYLCFCLVRILFTYTSSSWCKGLSIAWGRGPWWTSLHTALSAPVRGQGSEAMSSKCHKASYVRQRKTATLHVQVVVQSVTLSMVTQSKMKFTILKFLCIEILHNKPMCQQTSSRPLRTQLDFLINCESVFFPSPQKHFKTWVGNEPSPSEGWKNSSVYQLRFLANACWLRSIQRTYFTNPTIFNKDLKLLSWSSYYPPKETCPFPWSSSTSPKLWWQDPWVCLACDIGNAGWQRGDKKPGNHFPNVRDREEEC